MKRVPEFHTCTCAFEKNTRQLVEKKTTEEKKKEKCVGFGEHQTAVTLTGTAALPLCQHGKVLQILLSGTLEA